MLRGCGGPARQRPGESQERIVDREGGRHDRVEGSSAFGAFAVVVDELFDAGGAHGVATTQVSRDSVIVVPVLAYGAP